MRREGTITYMDPVAPTVEATRVDGQLVIVCPWCGHKHYHGAGNRPGDGDGHRVAHCGASVGYYVRERRDVS